MPHGINNRSLGEKYFAYLLLYDIILTMDRTYKKSYLSVAILAMVLAFLFSQLAVTLVSVILASVKVDGTSLWCNAILNLVNQGCFLGVFFLIYTRNKEIYTRQLFHKIELLPMIICLVLGVSSLYLLSPLVNITEWALALLPLKNSGIGFKINTIGKLIYSIILLGIVPAVCEELLFRGAIFNCLRTKSNAFAIFLSSLMFAIFHMSGYQFVYPLLFGFLLGLIMLNWGNIYYCMFAHFINNLFVLISNYLQSSTTIKAPTGLEIFICVACTLLFVGLMVGFYFYGKHTNNKVENVTEKQNSLIFWVGLVCMIAIWTLVFIKGIG